MKRPYYGHKVDVSRFWGHGSNMRAAMLILLALASRAGQAFGVWKPNEARSTAGGDRRIVALRIEPHTSGEVFTLDTLTSDGRASTSSTILFFDGKPRDFKDSVCSGTQSSRRVDDRTVEILRECAGGRQIRLVWRAEQPGVLILEMTERQRDGRHSERRLVMEKQ
jgi:hypothetical protein